MSSIVTNHIPKVSIIMPAYNTADLIAASLDSVLAQSFQDFEIIVVNDGSPDTPDLERVLAPYLDKIIYINQENKRAAGARNTAIRRARGKFLAFLDSDDQWLPDHLSVQMELFEKDAELDLIYSNCFAWSDPRLQQTFMDCCPSEGPATFVNLVPEKCQIPVSTVVARKEVIEKAGLFDERLQRCDDYDLWLRVAFHGAKIGYTRRVQARLNGGRPGSLGASNVHMLEACWLILEKMDRELPLSVDERACVRQRSSEVRAQYLFEEGKIRLNDGQFQRARTLFSEANAQLRRPLLGVVQLGLKVAPRTTRNVVSLVRSAKKQVASRLRRDKVIVAR
ncbi:MAG TPA: glycosyltransferase family A protein [Terriglobales bacterium]|jgi:glycosyltransferase involved in cell wall biosynthesis|nr:glycosyltransferase family A protein [Terriglobales bacterium]